MTPSLSSSVPTVMTSQYMMDLEAELPCLPEPAPTGASVGDRSSSQASVAEGGEPVAPSAVLAAAVQLAQAQSSRSATAVRGGSVVTDALSASQTVVHPVVYMQHQPSMPVRPGMSPQMQPGVPGWRTAPGVVHVAGPSHPSRRRWASISDDDASNASPMMWPARSPLLRMQHPAFMPRSRSGTPYMGPAVPTHPGSSSAALAVAAAAGKGGHQAFMLPSSSSDAPQPAGFKGTGKWANGPPGGAVQAQTGVAWGPGRQAAFAQAPRASTAGRGRGGVQGKGFAVPTVQAWPVAAGAQRALNGLTLVWLGERAYRAPAVLKEQIENIGFMVKVYRSADKCCRALGKRPVVAPTCAFLVTEAESEALLAYLCERKAVDVRVVVDADGMPQAEAQKFTTKLQWPEESSVVVATGWEAVLAALHNINKEAAQRVVAAGGLGVRGMFDGEGADSQANSSSPDQAAAAAPPAPPASDTPWTLVWISDQAFKPAAVGQKERLESLGCQVKGYKTHKNAARALDKKRTLARTVVLVSGAEAAPFMAYLASRPEIAETPVVVEASARSVPLREGPTVQVAEDFEAAVAAVCQVAADPCFQ